MHRVPDRLPHGQMRKGSGVVHAATRSVSATLLHHDALINWWWRR